MKREPLTFDPIFYNGAINFVETKWQRRLSDHEKHLSIEIYNYIRTALEVEEIKIIEDLRK